MRPFYKRLRRLREDRRLSMREVAKLINVPETTYREWEYGRAIRGEPYIKIARALGVSLEELLGDEAHRPEDLERDIDQIIGRLIELKSKLAQFNKT
jgi:transcriptional regulator with XRE-family HTH domain